MFNASTGLETTLFWAKVAAVHLPEALDVLSDMLLHATFDPTELEKERSVIGEEIKYSLDAPDSLAQIRATELQWPDHPLGRDIAGTRASVMQLGRESLLTYMQHHYRPDQTILGVAGHVEHNQVVSWAEEHLSDWRSGTPVLWEAAPPDRGGPKLHIEFKDSEQAHLSFSLAGLSRTHPDRYALRLLNVILGQGMRSRLFQTVRERLGLAYSVESYISTLEDTGAIGIYAGVAAERAAEAILAIVGQLQRLRKQPVPRDELDKALEFMRGRLALSLEDSFAVAAWYARQHLQDIEILTPEESMARFEAVGPDDMQRVAQRLLREERLNLAIVGPFSENGDRFREAIRF
jgi:predicted Zn-dependent peptidase